MSLYKENEDESVNGMYGVGSKAGMLALCDAFSEELSNHSKFDKDAFKCLTLTSHKDIQDKKQILFDMKEMQNSIKNGEDTCWTNTISADNMSRANDKIWEKYSKSQTGTLIMIFAKKKSLGLMFNIFSNKYIY